MRHIYFIIAVMLAFSASVAEAQWTGPSQTPPNGNTAAPINTGTTAQVKNGGLSVNAFSAYLNSYFAQNIGIGVSSPGADLEIYRDNTDSEIRFHDPNDAWYTMGIDVSDSRKFKLNYGSFAGENDHIVLTSGGNVGIRTANPGYALDVAGDIRAQSGWIRTTGNSGWYSDTYGGGWYMQDSTWIRSYNSKPVFMSAGLDTGSGSSSGVGCDGGLGGGYKFRVCGDMGATGFFYTSDKSLKKDIEPLTGALEKVKKLEGVSFVWKKDDRKDMGLIAQDVEKVYPELVHQAADGKKSVEYGNLVAPLIEAVKEQQRQIDALRAEIESLKSQR